ncbi:MAG: hypothetical protein IKF38_02920 [Clostridia bacterium]|nr:hypothetical protein [Clostridia bacterium]
MLPFYNKKTLSSPFSEFNSNFGNLEDTKKPNNLKDENSFFELFGLKLYLDDILLIGLLFFLYQEKVKDDELFISLILLLLS